MKLRSIVVSLAAISLACTGANQNAKVAGPQVRETHDVATQGKAGANNAAAPEVPQVSARAKLYFEDAVKSWDSQKKSGKPDYASLEAKFQKAADEDPRFGEAYYDLGVLAERQGKTDQAMALYKQALKAKPTLRQAAENLAVILQNKGDLPSAVEIYQQILTVYPDDASSRARLAEIYRQNGETDRALEFAREALMRDPKTLQAYKVMMLANLEKKQLSMAKLVALRALKIDENDPELYYTIGLILVQENDGAKARLQFVKAAEVRPDYLPAQVMLAKLALKEEDYAGAEEHLRRILQSDGKNAEALVDLGVAYKGQGQYDKALQAYDAAEKIKPELAAIQFNRGVIYAEQKGAPEKGLEYYQKYVTAMGGENAIPTDHPVFERMNVAKTIIQKREEQKRLDEQKKQEEAEALKQAAEMEKQAQEAEAAQKAAEQNAKNSKDKGNAAKDAVADDKGGDVKAADGKQGTADVKPASDKQPEKKKEEKKQEPPPQDPPKPEQKAAPKAEKKAATSDEPSDGL
ncbi:MAG: adventurous gliding motility TPR repeat lipoprotein GltE [Myxococcaceae bacterium]